MIWHKPTHQNTHPPNYTPTHGWRSFHRFQIFKQNWNISISSSAIEFWMIPGVPSLGGGEGGGMGVGVVRGCIPSMCTCTRMHAHACASTRVWHHREFPGIPQMGAAICMKLSCLPHVHVRSCVCMCTCVGGTPQLPPPPYTHPPPPELQGAQNTKIQ